MQRSLLGPDEQAPAPAPSGTLLTTVAGVHVTTDALAELFAVSSRAINQMVAAGAPKVGRNRYALAEVMAWWIGRRDHRALEQAESAREQLYQAQTAKTELEVERLAGEVISIDTFEATITEFLTTVIDRIEAAPARMTRSTDKRAQLEEVTRDARDWLADQLGRLADRRAARAPSGNGAAAPKRRRVGRPTALATRRQPDPGAVVP